MNATPKQGDHSVVTYLSSAKVHVATLTKLVKNVNGMDLWSGNILCDARPGYYLRFAKDSKVRRCPQCFRRWRLAGNPPLLGYTPDDLPAKGDIELPWGWREVEPVGYNSDGEPDRESDPKVKELRRFQRGQRIVRIAEVGQEHLEKFHRFAIQWAFVGKTPNDTNYDADFQKQLKLAREWMWLGGSPRR